MVADERKSQYTKEMKLKDIRMRWVKDITIKKGNIEIDSKKRRWTDENKSVRRRKIKMNKL